MNYVIFTFVEKLIKLSIEQGYISRKYKDVFGKECVQKIPLNQLESVTYVYDDLYDNDTIIRMHKFKSNNTEEKEPIFLPYCTNDIIKTYGNYNNDHKYKYCIKPEIL